MLNQDDADDIIKANNERHQHFIKVLEDTLEILKRKQWTKNEATPPTNDEYLNKVTNMFECLELGQSDQLEDNPEFIPTPKVENQVEYKLETSDTDMSFAVYCFLKDLTNIRLFVRRTWREFKSGKIGLQSAALTTNAAIGMIDKLGEEFQEAVAHFKEIATQSMHPEIMKFIREGDTATKKKDPVSFMSWMRSTILSPITRMARLYILVQ